MNDRFSHASESGESSVKPSETFVKPRSVRRVAIFTSPRAGSGARREQIPKLLELLEQDGIAVQVVHDPRELRIWIQENRGVQQTLTTAGSQHDSGDSHAVVVAAGGDGTITLASSLLHDSGDVAPNTQRPMPLLVPMPLGTENLLARHFGHRADATHVRDTILTGTVGTMDLGLVQQTPRRIHPMLTMVSCGFDADVVRGLHLRRKGHINRLSYLRPVLRSMRQYRFPELTVQSLSRDGVIEKEVRCGWAMVFNLPSYGGGLVIEPDAIGDDGLFDVITFAGRSILSGLGYVAGIRTGSHLSHRDVQRFRADSVRITSTERVHYQIDGDYIGPLPIEIAMRPQAIGLILPV